MTEEQRRRAFDRFWRAPDAPKGGTGLGLALVQRLAHASGGDVLLRAAASASGGLDAVVRLPSVAAPRRCRRDRWRAPRNGCSETPVLLRGPRGCLQMSRPHQE
jgi:signal transduction histidine kinase